MLLPANASTLFEAFAFSDVSIVDMGQRYIYSKPLPS